MKDINNYLFFNGNAREAMTFYEKCLGGELELMPYSAGPDGHCDSPKDAKDRIMHACLTNGSALLMASDTMPGMPFEQGNNFSVCVTCESRQEVDRLFAALGEKGKVTMPVQDTFWGAYFGMLIDRFGIGWMFSFENPKHG